MSALDLYSRETEERLARLTPVQVPEASLMDNLPAVLGGGFASTLIMFPIAYLALSRQFKSRPSNTTILAMFVIAVPFVGFIQAKFGGGNSESFSGLFVLLGLPLLVCLGVIKISQLVLKYRDRNTDPQTVEAEAGKSTLFRLSPNHFVRPAQRIAFILLVLGSCSFLAGLIGYWNSRGFYINELKYDLREIFLDTPDYRRGWAQWCARIGLVIAVCGYVVAYHYDRIVAPIARWISRLTHWVKTGE